MCTAINFKTEDHYFGRNLDYEHGYGESIAVVPRNFPIGNLSRHYALIGTAHVLNGYPLFYDAAKGTLRGGVEFCRKRILRQTYGRKKQRRSI